VALGGPNLAWQPRGAQLRFATHSNEPLGARPVLLVDVLNRLCQVLAVDTKDLWDSMWPAHASDRRDGGTLRLAAMQESAPMRAPACSPG